MPQAPSSKHQAQLHDTKLPYTYTAKYTKRAHVPMDFVRNQEDAISQ